MNAQIVESLIAKIYEFMYLNTFVDGRGDSARHLGVLVAIVGIVSANVLAARKSPYLVLTGVMLFGVILVLNVVKRSRSRIRDTCCLLRRFSSCPIVLGTLEFLELPSDES